MTGFIQTETMDDLRQALPDKFYDKILRSLEFIVAEVDEAEQVYLFGSCARKNAKWDSDVDLAIISKNTITDHYLRGYVIDTLDIESEHGVRADVIFRTPQMHDISKTFRTVFEQDKVLLWERRSNVRE